MGDRANNHPVRLRPADPGDCERVWQLNNEPGARAASRSVATIPLTDHVRWYQARLGDPTTALHMIEAGDAGPPIGVVRVERRGPAAELSMSVDPRMRGRGVGSAAARAAAAAAAERWPEIPLEAWVADGNQASMRCFVAAGFVLVGRRVIDGRYFRCYRYRNGQHNRSGGESQ
ncbi:MAG TPA: GNAT family N-acetyltransferase [Kofleriaceae bacterium]|nr:GNAT family N-acetyltransferase [Kofleriaceae bacterium]